jgi:isochorismate synthase
MIFDAISNQIKKNLPFVVYKKPNSNQIIAFLQRNDQIATWNPNANGFVFHPFHEGNVVFFDENICEIIQETSVKYLKFSIIEKDFQSKLNQEIFEELVTKTIVFLSQNSLDKIVISTYEEVEISNNKLEIFQKIISNYSTAFCYWFYHPKVGEWMGATPELLLQKIKNQITTVSLAGTKIYQENLVWKDKEKTEQQFVTNYIENTLEKYCKNIEIGDVNTIKAGKLAHLKTIIQASIIDDNTIQYLIQSLHPTAAVCGLPKEAALSFILKEENYKRAYYTGFLGEWNKDFENIETEKTQLYVNLRCMQILDNLAKIYVGCGITKDSNSKKEFLEILNKSKTMRVVIN